MAAYTCAILLGLAALAAAVPAEQDPKATSAQQKAASAEAEDLKTSNTYGLGYGLGSYGGYGGYGGLGYGGYGGYGYAPKIVAPVGLGYGGIGGYGKAYATPHYGYGIGHGLGYGGLGYGGLGYGGQGYGGQGYGGQGYGGIGGVGYGYGIGHGYPYYG